MASSLHIRHIADAPTSNSTTQQHWGYVSRTLPCTNDAGSCAYLDSVYWMHDVSMLYTFIMWAVIGGILAVVVLLRFMKPEAAQMGWIQGEEEQKGPSLGAYYQAWRGVRAAIRRRLLPETIITYFGNVTRLQVVILGIMLAYLLIFSLVGIVYKTWITPVKSHPGLYNTRSGLGGFSDRIGALAYALTPLTVALATRESVLSLATGLPYQSFNFMHRWLGRVIFIQAFVHTLGWTLIEGRFYKPQPKTYNDFIREKYIVWGCVAMALISFLYIFSIRRVIKWTGHEFFRKTHYVVAALYIGACWGHWSHLACWMIAALAIWGLDRGLRLLRVLLMHVGYIDGDKGFGFHPAHASLQYLDDPDGGVIRMEFTHNHDGWSVGQHFFLCFPALSIWQSHPFTVASVPAAHPASPKHVYIIRCRKGETGRLRALATELGRDTTTPVVISGPYGHDLLPSCIDSYGGCGGGPEPTNLLAVAGGTGVSLTLPVVLAATASPEILRGAAVDFIWSVRRASNKNWIEAELAVLRKRARDQMFNLNIHIYITQEAPAASSTSSSFAAPPPVAGGGKSSGQDEEKTGPDVVVASSCCSTTASSDTDDDETYYNKTYLRSAHPSLDDIVSGFLDTRASSHFRTRVIASGPAGMGRDLRAAVARVSDGAKVWKGDRRFDVELDWDDRMG